MNILLLSSSYNSLTQHAHVWLKQEGHIVFVATGMKSSEMHRAVQESQPDLIICPMLTQIVPEEIWRQYTCIVIHPGIAGDRGATSLDWAILNEESEWGVTAVEAAKYVDSGPIWASSIFPMRQGSKSSLYRDEVTHAAMKAMKIAVRRFESRNFVPAPLDYSKNVVRGQFRPTLRVEQRSIDWNTDNVATIIRKIRSADSSPGVLDEISGIPVYLYGAHEEGSLVGKPGCIIATRDGAICRAAVDGAVWISHLKRKCDSQDTMIKLPATQVLGNLLNDVPEISFPLHYTTNTKTFREICYEELNDVGYLRFRFYNGAMSTEQCQRLLEAYQYARQRPTKVIVLSGGRDYFSNGIHLNVIEASADPAEESWRNINAMDDLVQAIITDMNHLTISVMYGSAGAGGVMLGIAADKVFAREGIVLNPHYKGMGGLYGSEYWTYILPKRVGLRIAEELTEQCQPISVQEAKKIGLIDDVIIQDDHSESEFDQFCEQIVRIAEKMAHSVTYASLLEEKLQIRIADEARKPLEQYRREELQEMKKNFWGNDPSYHEARRAFVRKLPSKGEMKRPVGFESFGFIPRCANTLSIAECMGAYTKSRHA